MTNHGLSSRLWATAATLFLCALAAQAQTTSFTYQGRLNDNNAAANGIYDLQFKLFDAAVGGLQQENTITREDVQVTNGIFTVTLDFTEKPFAGADVWLEIAVRPGVGNAVFTTLAPRQKFASTPYAIRSFLATTAENLACAGCLNGAQISSIPGNLLTGTVAGNLLTGTVAGNLLTGTVAGNLISGTIPVAAVPSGNGNYIQNTNVMQPNTHFSIGGNGTLGGMLSAGAINSGGEYRMNGNRILSAVGNENLFAGMGTGMANTIGVSNTFFGQQAGEFNTTGNGNSFFGASAGYVNQQGSNNAFFGERAGQNNTNGNGGSFFGRGAGSNNTSGGGNVFVGFVAGNLTSTGSFNTFLGTSAGTINVTGSSNTLVGSFANFSAIDLVNATAIGAGATVGTSNTIVLGRNNGDDTVRVPGMLAVSTLGSAGATALCRNGSNQLSTCSSSRRYKENFDPFFGGLNLVKQLRPVTFDWKSGGMRDVGFVAEEVAAVEPLLATYNDKGEIEGVKYAQLTTVLINAVKEQQSLIEQQKTQLNAQRQELDLLKKAFCAERPQADFCQAPKP